MLFISKFFDNGRRVYNKEQGTLGIENGPISKLLVGQQQFTCFKTLTFFSNVSIRFLATAI